MDFNKSIFENRKELGRPFIAAHRGICGGNIPCNSTAAYKAALVSGADVVELDVAKSSDGVFYAFHPGMEHVFLRSDRQISQMTSKEVDSLVLYNSDMVKTSYRVPRLKEAFAILKDKVYINVDKFWVDIEGISKEIYEAGVEKQVIVKTGTDEKTLARVAEFAPELMFMPVVWGGVDRVTSELIKKGVNVVGAEIIFQSEDMDCISDRYINDMHERGLLIWANSIIYNEDDVLTAYHSDDTAFNESYDKGWGWLIDKGVDFIQTDWCLNLKMYIESRK